MAKRRLTPNQKAFAKKYLEIGTAGGAYRKVYKPKGSDNTTYRRAYSVLRSPIVQEEIKRLESKHMERHNITIDELLSELEEARALAKNEKLPGSMVSATMGKGKLLGLDKVEISHTGNIQIITGITGAPNSLNSDMYHENIEHELLPES